MTTKKKEVAYVGYANQQLTDSLIQSRKETPPYEDSGVRYQGYYKKQVGTDEYKTNPQNKIVIHQSINGSTFQSIYNIPQGKKLIVASCVISTLYSGAGTDAFYVTDGDSGTIPPQRILFYYRFNSNQIQNLIFEPKIEFTTGVWIGQVNTNSDITFYGFLEDL